MMVRLQQVVVVLAGVGLAAAMVLLGVWQLDVYHAQGARAAERRAAEPPVDLTAVAPPGEPIADGFGRTVRFSGSYDPDVQQLLPLRGRAGRFRVLSAFRLTDGSVVAVIRGVAGADAAPPPPGDLLQRGVLLPSEDDGVPAESVRLPTLVQQWPGPLVGGYVTLSADLAVAQGLEPAATRLPRASGRLRNGAYALQWWVFAAFALFLAMRMARDVGRRAVLDPVDQET